MHAVAHGELVDAGPLDMAGDAEEAGAAVALGAELGVSSAPPMSRMWGAEAMVSALLMTVGPPYRPTTAGKGGLMRGHAALAFERLHEGRLFADLVGAGAGLGDDVEVDALAAEDVLAEEAFFVGSRPRPFSTILSR